MYLVDIYNYKDRDYDPDFALAGDFLDGIITNDRYVNDEYLASHDMGGDGLHNKDLIDIYNGYEDACIEIDEHLGRFYGEYEDMTDEELYAEAKSVVDYWLGPQDNIIITRIIDKIYATDKHDDILFAEILTILTGTEYEYNYVRSYGDGLGIFYPVKWRDSAKWAADVILGNAQEVEIAYLTDTQIIQWRLPETLSEYGDIVSFEDDSYFDIITHDYVWGNKSEICDALGLPENDTYILNYDGEWI